MAVHIGLSSSQRLAAAIETMIVEARVGFGNCAR
jgi:hypothetical protein